jgi:hypothetical protein
LLFACKFKEEKMKSIKDWLCIPAAFGAYSGFLIAGAPLNVSVISGLVAGVVVLGIQIYNANFNKDR